MSGALVLLRPRRAAAPFRSFIFTLLAFTWMIRMTEDEHHGFLDRPKQGHLTERQHYPMPHTRQVNKLRLQN